MSTRQIHPEFPREPIPGAVGGAQPKLLLRKNELGKYVSPGLSNDEVSARFELCDDLVGQLLHYVKRKKLENPDWSDEFNLARTKRGVEKKVRAGAWRISLAEVDWVMSRVSESLGTLEL